MAESILAGQIMIYFTDLYPPECQVDVNAAVQRVLTSRRYILGREVVAFEEEWAKYCGAAYCIGVGNGFDALQLALKAHGIRPGDDILVPSNTCLPTWCAVIAIGAKPQPMEPDGRTYCVTTADIDRAVTKHTKAIVPVHLYGQPCDLEAIGTIAERYNIPVIEDAAQAHGAQYRGRRIGGHGNTCAWSFYPTKNLGAYGDAGAVTTDDRDIAERVRAMRAYGCAGAINSRLDEIQAAVLREKLRYLPAWNYRRATNAAQYRAGLRCVPWLLLPIVPDYAEPCWHQFVIRHPRRDALRMYLAERGIETMVHYPTPPHVTLGLDYALPVAEQLSREVLSLPVGPHMNSEDIETVITAIKEFE